MTTAFRPFHVEDSTEPAGALPVEAAALLLRKGLIVARSDGARLDLAGGGPIDLRLEDIRAALCSAGLIGPARGESMPLRLSPDGPELARVDRSAVRILGMWVDKVHVNGLVPQPEGPPLVWLSRRSAAAEWNPDRFDTLVAGGRAAGRSIDQTLVAEAWEEAGISGPQLDGLRGAGRLSVTYVTSKGLHREVLTIFDLGLDPGFRPVCRDAEIAWHSRRSLADLERLVAQTDEMKFSSRLVCRDLLGRLGAAATI